MKHVLVTGAGGYIGSTLVPKLLEKGYFVKAIDRFFFGVDKLKPHPTLTILLEDCRRLKDEHFNHIDAVIDLIAITNDPSCELFNEPTYEMNQLDRLNSASVGNETGVKR